jgi:hypothetical protein
MRILFHATGLMLSICLFLLGYLMANRRAKFARSLAHTPTSSERLAKFFLYGGGTLEVLSSIWGLLEGISVILLTSGLLVDAVIGM